MLSLNFISSMVSVLSRKNTSLINSESQQRVSAISIVKDQSILEGHD